MLTPQIHNVQIRGEFEAEGFRCRVLHLEVCGDPDCECAFIGDDPLRGFVAPANGSTNEWLYLGFGRDLDRIVSEIADLLAADAESQPTIMDRSAALFGISWELISTAPIRCIDAQAKAVARLTDERTKAMLAASIGDLRAIKARTHGKRIERMIGRG